MFGQPQSQKNIQDEDGSTQALKRKIQAKEDQLKEAMQTNSKVVLAKEQTIQSLHHAVEAKENQLTRLKQQLEQTTATLRGAIDQRDREIKRLTSSQLSLPRAEKAVAMVWKTLPDAPHYFKESSAVVGDKAYFGWFNEISEFDSNSYQWCPLPKHHLSSFALVNVNDELTSVGGSYSNKLGTQKNSNKIYYYANGKWVEKSPPMPTKRSNCAAVYSNHVLVVAGGDRNDSKLTTVEVYNNSSKQWSSVGSLPFPMSSPSVSICGGNLYVHARETLSDVVAVVRCSLLALAFSTPMAIIWDTQTASLSVKNFSLVSVNDCLLAIGGESPTRHRSNAIYQYNSIFNSWHIISHLSIARSQCPIAVFTSKLLVVGGSLGSQPCELATIH